MENVFNNFLAALTLYLPTVLLAIGILIVGWIIALVVSALVKALLNRTTLDDRIANMMGGTEGQPAERVNIETWISRAVFWIIIVFTIVAFLQALNLTVVAGPFNLLLNQILAVVPGVLAALALLLIAWVVASVLRLVVTRLIMLWVYLAGCLQMQELSPPSE
jgi:hypothetical protein